jgi:hypothetical protein
MNRIGKKQSSNRSKHEADLLRKSSLAKFHPVNPVHPVKKRLCGCPGLTQKSASSHPFGLYLSAPPCGRVQDESKAQATGAVWSFASEIEEETSVSNDHIPL